MITTSEAWLKLIDGLRIATKRKTLKWEEANTNPSSMRVTHLAAVALGDGTLFRASTRKGSYEIASGSPNGTGPFTLRAWEMDGLIQRALGEVSSGYQNIQTLPDLVDPKIRSALDQLYSTVTLNTESSSDIVDRLLGDL
jgi:hypothetical protein